MSRLAGLLFLAAALVGSTGCTCDSSSYSGDDDDDASDAGPDGEPHGEGGEGLGEPDAAPGRDAGPLSCLGDPPATTAIDPVVLSGTLTDPFQTLPVTNVDIEVHRTDGTVVAASRGGPDGGWAIEIPTGGTPFDGYAEFRKSGYVSTYFFPPDPLTEDVDLDVELMTSDELDLLYITLDEGSTFRDPARATVVLGVTDCVGYPAEGAVVELDPTPQRVQYVDTSGRPPVIGGKATYSNGVAFGLNAPVGSIELGGVWMEEPLRARMIEGFENAFVLGFLHP